MATAGAGRGTGPERAFAATLALSGEVVLDAEESAHLVRSRRAQVGDPIVLFDGVGGSRAATLTAADARAARVRIEGDYPDRTPARRVRLAVALPEMGRADRLVAMLAELGVAELACLTCARSAPGRGEQALRRALRWAKLAREACKVNGSARALVLAPPVALAAALERGALLLDPDPTCTPLALVAADLADARWILVGPEGGFTDPELEQARAIGTPVLRLGPTALRVETAAIAAAAVLLGR